jgi:hypothetical protein
MDMARLPRRADTTHSKRRHRAELELRAGRHREFALRTCRSPSSAAQHEPCHAAGVPAPDAAVVPRAPSSRRVRRTPLRFEGRVEPGPMGHSALGTSSTFGEDRAPGMRNRLAQPAARLRSRCRSGASAQVATGHVARAFPSSVNPRRHRRAAASGRAETASHDDVEDRGLALTVPAPTSATSRASATVREPLGLRSSAVARSEKARI